MRLIVTLVFMLSNLSSILRIYERGVLDKIQERMLPKMPWCATPVTFHSASLTDVYTAFFLLVAGMIIAISIGIAEKIWNKRKQMQETIVRGIREHHLIPHIHFHHHHGHHHEHHNNYLSFPGFLAGRLPGYHPTHLTMLRDQARQVQSFIGLLEHDNSSEILKRSVLELRFPTQRRSANHKRASWSSFSGLSKRRMRLTERILPTLNAKNIQILPFRD